MIAKNAASLRSRNLATQSKPRVILSIVGRQPKEIVPGAGPVALGFPALGTRALNVLRLLAEDLTGEAPPQGPWLPPKSLLEKITVKRLGAARNCGPQTRAEIVAWAATQGVTIKPTHYAGKSLSETWRTLEARFLAGRLTTAEIAEALDKSIRRKSARVPTSIQKILLVLLSQADKFVQ